MSSTPSSPSETTTTTTTTRRSVDNEDEMNAKDNITSLPSPATTASPSDSDEEEASSSDSDEEEEEEEVHECRICGKTSGPPLCQFHGVGLYGPDYVGGDDVDCVHYKCATSTTSGEWAALSVGQIKKRYGQGKAAKLALTKTRTAYGPRKFGNHTELVLLKEFVTNLVASGGSATPKQTKSKSKKMTIAAMKRSMKFKYF